MDMIKDYEMVIGLEVHVELKTESKIFCSCSTAYGAEPNTQTCPVCLGHPGVLPVLNKKVVEYAVKAGLATNCTIANYSKQDRKNYFYPDLPKAYQISQYDLPLCEHGYIDIETQEGTKRIRITRIHIEEDAGKLIHDDKYGTMIDCNRCGVPLIEIVSEPDIRSALEAKTYLQKLRAVILYTGISDCRMHEGSIRCDVNISVRKKGQKEFGVRTEMKNLNSYQSVVRAIEYEYKRQVETLESGGTVIQETRKFDADTGKTYAMRSKEDANDYRYFPDPDLPAIEITDEEIGKIKESIPVLPDERKKKYVDFYGITPYTSETIVTDPNMADYFEKVTAQTDYPLIAANFIVGKASFLNKSENFECPISSVNMASLVTLLGEQTINEATAKKLLSRMWEEEFEPSLVVEKENLKQINDRETLLSISKKTIDENPKLFSDYKKGKTKVFDALMGRAMQKTSGKANPVILEECMHAELNRCI